MLFDDLPNDIKHEIFRYTPKEIKSLNNEYYKYSTKIKIDKLVYNNVLSRLPINKLVSIKLYNISKIDVNIFSQMSLKFLIVPGDITYFKDEHLEKLQQLETLIVLDNKNITNYSINKLKKLKQLIVSNITNIDIVDIKKYNTNLIIYKIK